MDQKRLRDRVARRVAALMEWPEFFDETLDAYRDLFRSDAATYAAERLRVRIKRRKNEKFLAFCLRRDRRILRSVTSARVRRLVAPLLREIRSVSARIRREEDRVRRLQCPPHLSSYFSAHEMVSFSFTLAQVSLIRVKESPTLQKIQEAQRLDSQEYVEPPLQCSVCYRELPKEKFDSIKQPCSCVGPTCVDCCSYIH